jgi:uncharacterized protein YpbB
MQHMRGSTGVLNWSAQAEMFRLCAVGDNRRAKRATFHEHLVQIMLCQVAANKQVPCDVTYTELLIQRYLNLNYISCCPHGGTHVPAASG